MAGDDDKTVWGQQLPSATPKQPARKPAAPSASDEKTVFGAALPGQSSAPSTSRPAQPAGGGRVAPSGIPRAAEEDTWLGGALPQAGGQQGAGWGGQPASRTSSSGYNPASYESQSLNRDIGAEMFPDLQPQEEAKPVHDGPQISLEDALKGSGLGKGGSSNPLVAASANLLILLGRLRTGLVELDAEPLMNHVSREIDSFERNALSLGANPADINDAKYALAGTADDIVQNLPGASQTSWVKYSMVAWFFQERTAGVRFFENLDAAMKAPGQKFNLLELKLACMSLGFEGQYRTDPEGGQKLSKIRRSVYETLRRVQPRPDEDISVRWAAVPLGGGRRFGGIPLWIVGGIAAGLVVATFAGMSTLLARSGSDVQQRILTLHSDAPGVSIERDTVVTQSYQAAESTQLQRLRDVLAGEIDAGLVEVEEVGDYVSIRVGDALRFDSGQATLKDEPTELLATIANAVDNEPGPLRVEGHTDSIPPSGRGRYKSNEELSEARANTVSELLKPDLADPGRLEVVGMGPVRPIADNETREGRAKNRRVEVMIKREGAL